LLRLKNILSTAYEKYVQEFMFGFFHENGSFLPFFIPHILAVFARLFHLKYRHFPPIFQPRKPVVYVRFFHVENGSFLPFFIPHILAVFALYFT